MWNDTSPRSGSRLLPSVLDQWARDEPARLYAVVPHAENSNNTFDAVTMLQMSCAVDVTAWWLTKAFGAGRDSQFLAYIRLSDLRYPIVLLAKLKIGWTVSWSVLPPTTFSSVLYLFMRFWRWNRELCLMIKFLSR